MLNGLMLIGNNWFTNALRYVTYFIDKGIYALAEGAYTVFRYLANATILDETIARNLTMRMYAVLGIIMIFVLAFNLLNYIVDPDKITDKKIGASAFIKDVVIALVLIAVTPLLFTKLYSLQSAILSSGVMENLILGGNSGNETATCEGYEEGDYNSLTECSIDNGANTMIASVYVAFLYPEDGSNFTALDCGNPEKDDGSHKDYCNAYSETKKTGSISPFYDFVTDEKYNYTPFLTTVAGIVLLFFMLSFCLNLAKRVGKLAIIQLMAPVPVTLELLPNKKGLRKVWVDNLIKVYLEVFFYLAVMYLIILLISFIPNTVETLFKEVGGNLGVVKLITIVMLIFGLLKFGKEAPQLIFDLIGIKSTGIIKEAAQRALAMGGVAANTAASIGTNAIQNFANTQQREDENPFGYYARKFGSTFAGATSAGARNLWAGRNAHNWKDAVNNRKTVNSQVQQKRRNRNAYSDSHNNNIWDITKGHVADFGADVHDTVSSFIKGGYDSSSAELSLLDRLAQATGGAKIDKSKDDTFKKFNTEFEDLKYAQKDEFTASYNEWKAGAPATNNTEADYFDYLSSRGGLVTDSRGAHDYSALTDAYKMKSSKEADMVKKNDGKLRVAAAEASALLDANPQLRDLTAKVKINGATSEMSLADALSRVANQDGSLKTGMEWQDLQNVMDAYNSAIGKRKSEVNARAAADKIREEQRKNRQGNSGGSSGSK